MHRSLLVLALAACGAAAPSCPLPAAPTAPVRPFLWKAEKPGGPVVWLYGTIHNAGEADVPRAAWDALAASPRFVSELGDTEPDPEKTVDLARLPAGKGLDELLPSDDWYDLRDLMRGKVKEDDLKRARPWYAMARLSATLAPPPSPTMDFALAKRARVRGIAVEPLEAWEVQLAALADTVQIADLQQAIHARKTMKCELDQLLATYRAGDLPAMERQLIVQQTYHLVVDRTKAWWSKLGDKPAFVAVGLAHLAGSDGLVAMYERAGYTVTRQ